MANIGIFPIDKNSPVGQLRLTVGDTIFTELPGATEPPPEPPPEPRNVDYANFSDDELEVLLAGADGSLPRATSRAYAKLAAIAAATGVTIKTNDLGYANEKRASELRELAKYWAAEADTADDMASDDIFEIVRYPGRDDSDPVIPRLV